MENSFRLYRYIEAQKKIEIAFFPNVEELLSFFNNPYEVEQRTGFIIKNPNFKTLLEVQAFIVLRSDVLKLEVYE